jgi:hypothetical protein
MPIKKVSAFQYLGLILQNGGSDSAAVQRALQRAKIMRGRLGRFLSKDQADPKSMASVSRTVVQAVLLYAGSESWVLTQQVKRSLQSFHHKCASYIMGQHI